MSRPSALRWVVASLTALLVGCGPVQSTSYLIDTETMLEAARTAQADKLAPYEWTAANPYLAKSKAQVGYSDFEQAVDYGLGPVPAALLGISSMVGSIEVGKLANFVIVSGNDLFAAGNVIKHVFIEGRIY